MTDNISVDDVLAFKGGEWPAEAVGEFVFLVEGVTYKEPSGKQGHRVIHRLAPIYWTDGELSEELQTARAFYSYNVRRPNDPAVAQVKAYLESFLKPYFGVTDAEFKELLSGGINIVPVEGSDVGRPALEEVANTILQNRQLQAAVSTSPRSEGGGHWVNVRPARV